MGIWLAITDFLDTHTGDPITVYHCTDRLNGLQAQIKQLRETIHNDSIVTFSFHV